MDLVDTPEGARGRSLQVRAGLDYGAVLAISGDYFGNAVNLRRPAQSPPRQPGQILRHRPSATSCRDWHAIRAGSVDAQRVSMTR